MRTAVIAITKHGAQLALKLQKVLPQCDLFVSERYAAAENGSTHRFVPSQLKSLIAGIWKQYDGFVCIMATGIVVRMIAPLLSSKQTDPAIVVMDDAGHFAISLLSGHLGGANELTERCAFASGARPVITTATDVNGLPSFDLLAKEHGWEIDDISRVKTLNRLLLDNEEIAVVDPSGKTRCWFHGQSCLRFYDTFAEALKSTAHGFVFVTNRHIPLHKQSEALLILRPRNLVLGIGCNRGTSADEIENFVQCNLRRIFLSIKSVRAIASATAKKDEAGLLRFAEKHGLDLICYSSEELNRVECPSMPSAHALQAIGAKGVSEPAAILASGGGRLILQKIKSDAVTLAVAEITEQERIGV